MVYPSLSPRVRYNLDGLVERLDAANLSLQRTLYYLTQTYVVPGCASVSDALTTCVRPCLPCICCTCLLPAEERQRRRWVEQTRAVENSFRFYREPYYNDPDEMDRLLGTNESELDGRESGYSTISMTTERDRQRQRNMFAHARENKRRAGRTPANPALRHWFGSLGPEERTSAPAQAQTSWTNRFMRLFGTEPSPGAYPLYPSSSGPGGGSGARSSQLLAGPSLEAGTSSVRTSRSARFRMRSASREADSERSLPRQAEGRPDESEERVNLLELAEEDVEEDGDEVIDDVEEPVEQPTPTTRRGNGRSDSSISNASLGSTSCRGDIMPNDSAIADAVPISDIRTLCDRSIDGVVSGDESDRTMNRDQMSIMSSLSGVSLGRASLMSVEGYRYVDTDDEPEGATPPNAPSVRQSQLSLVRLQDGEPAESSSVQDGN